ncbi:GATA-type zinc finger protein 1 [Smittium mucronatum]|uniref:GATA-type zinc finger protein 1 n=1 Tax=Smittium mucronatum TaxID=133383 RepID=A0A1R0GYU0_9FUNG|nr:GATA-type zinc finger protein 1 [Smittium mucronatum]
MTMFVQKRQKRKGTPLRSPERNQIGSNNPGVIFSFPSIISAIRETIPKKVNFGSSEITAPTVSPTSNLVSDDNCLLSSFYNSSPRSVSHKRSGSDGGLFDHSSNEISLLTEFGNSRRVSRRRRLDSLVENSVTASSPLRPDYNTISEKEKLVSIRSNTPPSLPFIRSTLPNSKIRTNLQDRLEFAMHSPLPPTNPIFSDFEKRNRGLSLDHHEANTKIVPNMCLQSFIEPSSQLSPNFPTIHSYDQLLEKKEHKVRKPVSSKKKLNVPRHCASCNVTSTPCWRPGWDALLSLCNSCGLRYKKGGIYCKSCSYVPMKTEITSAPQITCKNCKSSISTLHS